AGLLPDGLAQLGEQRLELAVEELVQALEAAVGRELPLIEAAAVDDFFQRQLLADALEPLALAVRPGAAREHLLQVAIDALGVRQQRVPEGSLADEAEDAGGDLLVGALAPGDL